MLGMSDGPIYFGAPDDSGMSASVESNFGEMTLTHCQKEFGRFIREFRYGNNIYPYRDNLSVNIRRGDFFLAVDLVHIDRHNGQLLRAIKHNPLKYIPACEKGLKDTYYVCVLGREESPPPNDPDVIEDIQLQLISSEIPMRMRELTASHLEHVNVIPGIVIQASKSQHKASRLKIECRQCKNRKDLFLPAHRQRALIPRSCDYRPADDSEDKCPQDPYIIVPDECDYWDSQHLKMQELPEDVPTGEMPRHISLHVTRSLVDKVVPGSRLIVVGVFSAVDESREAMQAASVRNSYVHVLGMKGLEQGSRSVDAGCQLTPEDEERFRQLVASEGIHEQIFKSIAPSIYGLEDVKKSVACLLFGGARKSLPDGTNLRGDINVLLFGDPSTAKSQFLKFVEKCAPIAVYTSGKGGSAAGLTAAIVRDASGSFALEGGAMVLADGGVVCIDEFDKMRTDDRVAIHEAMEQQTISIAKAGITTVLNTRCSVLAAANPAFGTYDSTKEAAEQIDFQSTILSRFDLIFLVRDERDPTKDTMIANHVISLHKGADDKTREVEGEISVQDLKKLIVFCRQRCSPRLTPQAAESLKNTYVEIRSAMHGDNRDSRARAIPITVRQLEAISRIGESLARMELSNEVTIQHTEEAVRLFTRSTLDAAKSGLHMEQMDQSQMEEVKRAEELIRLRLHIGGSAKKSAIIADLTKRGLDAANVQRALHIMLLRQDLEDRPDFSVRRKR